MNLAVFVGPSLHGVDAAMLTGFDLRPPAGCGDLLAAVLAGTSAIGLIDGVFDHAPSVWHKEILYALSQGVRVYGAASMGALRAAECAAFGMIGVGRIFEDYRSGRRVADADVGVAHAPAEFGYAPLNIALVDVEATLDQAIAHGAVTPQLARTLLRAARAIHFKDRDWPEVIAGAGLGGDEAGQMEALLERHACSQKQEDALALLARMREDQGKPAPTPDFTFQHSGFFEVLKRRVEETVSESKE